MSEHRASIRWNLPGGEFLKGRYTREHTWSFDGGATVPASSSPAVVPAPYSNPAHVDPEEAFVASLASCHMLTFLYVAYRQGIEVLSYEDDAVGVMSKNAEGVPWISSVVLSPAVRYGAGAPDPEQEAKLHEAAHHGCFISNSVKTEIKVTPVRRP
jgi:organic hydroperoxide reductase OsmC/OhrA